MKKLLISIIISFILLVIACIYPIVYHFSDKEIASIPDYISYEDAFIKSLPEQILLEAEKHNCKNFILPLTNLPKAPSHLPFMIDDINLAISTYDKWRLAVDNQQRQQIKDRLDKNLEKWGSMLSSQDMYNIITQRQRADINIDYSVHGTINRIPNVMLNDLVLNLTFNHEVTSSKVFDIRIVFTDPNSVTALEKEVELKKQKLNNLSQKNDIALFFVRIFLIITGLLLIVYGVLILLSHHKTMKIKKDLLMQIKQLEDLINDGHFVAAFDLMNMYLEHFPNDIDMRAKRDRLLDLTNNEPKKAQIAFVEAKKIQLKLSKPLKGEYLSLDEKENLKNLIPYHPELKDNYTKLLEFEETDKYLIQFNDNLDKINLLIKDKNFSYAKTLLDDLERASRKYNCTDLELSRLYDIKQVLNKALNSSKYKFNLILERLPRFQVALIKKNLSSLLEEHKDFKEAVKLLNTINNKELANGFSLINNQRVLHIIHNSECILGREETGIKTDIVINDRYISRPHLKILLKDNEVIIQDLNSTGGTYINGEKVEQHSLKDSDLLILAKVFDLNFSIYKDDNSEIGAMLINFTDCSYILLRTEFSFSIKEGKLFTGNDFKLLVNEDVFAINDDNGFNLIERDTVINLNNQNFTVTK